MESHSKSSKYSGSSRWEVHGACEAMCNLARESSPGKTPGELLLGSGRTRDESEPAAMGLASSLVTKPPPERLGRPVGHNASSWDRQNFALGSVVPKPLLRSDSSSECCGVFWGVMQVQGDFLQVQVICLMSQSRLSSCSQVKASHTHEEQLQALQTDTWGSHGHIRTRCNDNMGNSQASRWGTLP